MQKEVYKGYKFQIYPTEEQKYEIERTFGACRYVFNGMLAYRKHRYTDFGEKKSKFDLGKVLTQVKKSDYWLNDFDSESLVYAVSDMCEAYDNFMKGRAKFPRFKSKNNPKDSYTTRRKKISEDSKINLGKKIGKVDIGLHSNFKPQICEKEVTVSKSPRGNFYVSVLVKEVIDTYEHTDKEIGIDLGVKTFATCSDESIYEFPKEVWKHESRIVFLQKKLSRQTRGSNKYEVTRKLIAKHHERIANIRNNFMHNVTTKLIKENDTICLEDLNVKGMMANRKLAKAIGRMSFYTFRAMLESKAKWHDRDINIIDRWFPSSKTCSKCGNVKVGLTLSDRVYKCDCCGLEIDRDYNASINILREGLKK